MQITALQHHSKADDLPPEQLAGNKLLSEQEKIHQASRQFEAILLRQILETTQKPVIKSKFADNSTAGSVYRDMVTSQLADSISKSGALGLAKTFEQQLQFSKGHRLEWPKGSEITRS
jgi:flagellar protein FlgJ